MDAKTRWTLVLARDDRRPRRRIRKLSAAEKLLLIEELWNGIARESNTVEPPAWHDQVLAKDATDYAREVVASRLAD